MNLSDLKPNPKNPRKITDKKLKALKKSLEEFGDLGGIVFNRRTGRLVGGHQRLSCFKSGQIVYDSMSGNTGHFVTDDGLMLSYREVDWDEAKEKAANIAANKGAGEWDWDQLKDWFLELDAVNFDLGLTMFDAPEIENLLGLTEPEFKPGSEDEQGKLDEKKKVECPECGHEFTP